MWCHRAGPLEGYPLSWAHYVVGIDWLARNQAREQLRLRDATKMAQPGIDAAARSKWERDHLLVAEWQ